MRVMFESWFVKYKVDVVFAGHVHAYERSVRTNILILNDFFHKLLWNNLSKRYICVRNVSQILHIIS